MHILAEESRSLDENVQAVDLGQTPADIVVLSFSDSDLAQVAASFETFAEKGGLTLRLASLAALRHPYSVDLYIEKVARHARLIIVRCLGGMDYWRYGVDELAITARSRGIALALLPGDHAIDPRLTDLSTLGEDDLTRLWGWFQAGGPANMASLVGWMATALGIPATFEDPVPLDAFGCVPAICGCGGVCRRQLGQVDARPTAPILFYRSLLLAADLEPVRMLVEVLAGRGIIGLPFFVTSLKDPAAAGPLAAALSAIGPDIILNTTAFSARREDGRGPLDDPGCPVIQCVIAATFRSAWEASSRGLSAADMAMNVVLPEVDGRIGGPVISFKGEAERSAALQFTRITHQGEASGIARAAELAASWVRLRQTRVGERRLALVLSDYPAKGGRTGYAVGLDVPASLAAMIQDMNDAGYPVDPTPESLLRELEAGRHVIRWPVDDYTRAFAKLPAAFRDKVTAAWGAPEADPGVTDGAFGLKIARLGKLLVAVQPDRGRRSARETDYHDPALPPAHGYVAFYLFLKSEQLHAMVHVGTHGTLEWLPGKAVALAEADAPAVLTGAMPVIYPFIVNNPGEAAQARRRISAVTLGHMTPPLKAAGNHGATLELEALLDEYASATSLDSRRAAMIADVILAKAKDSGLAEETGLDQLADRAAALTRLSAFLCDLKDMRIGDGLHVYGRTPEVDAAHAEAFGLTLPDFAALADASARSERAGFLAALDGRFIAPGPAGAPASGRLDVLPTGRNLFAVDPRAIPTRTAYDIGARIADAVVERYVQDEGDWPQRMVLDLWGSASMRTGGEDLAQAFALIGARPVWDAATSRVSGVEILSTARSGRPRVDVTLRVSGLFRDVFPTQLALFEQAVRAIAALDEDAETNPLVHGGHASEPRIFAPAPGNYGAGVVARVTADDWTDRADLGNTYLASSHFAYAGAEAAGAAPDAFARQVAAADAFVHVQDMAGQDVLDSDAFADHQGGFAATGTAARLYHVDATLPALKVRPLAEEIAKVVRARATNPKWIAGQMRHGHRGAAEIAETVSNLLAFAASGDLVSHRQFDLVFDATLGDDAVRAFMIAENPLAAAACARSFDIALRRGLWVTRRNSVAGPLAEAMEAAA